jgi:hypothetical protein
LFSSPLWDNKIVHEFWDMISMPDSPDRAPSDFYLPQ